MINLKRLLTFEKSKLISLIENSLKMNKMDVFEETENKENQEKVWKRHEEYQYLDQIRHIINYGKTRLDRTGKYEKMYEN